MAKKVDSREVGLAIGLIAGKYFFNTSDLHYGYWPADLPVSLANMARAQELHTEFMLSHFPVGVRSVLDVGCGAGVLAAKLLELGYEVEGLSPSKILVEKAREAVDDRAKIYESKFEDLKTDRQYDLVMFSESYQYVRQTRALEKAMALLPSGGHLLICDFFKTDAQDGVIGGGHRLASFYDRIGRFPFEPVTDIDITARTAPNMALVNDALVNVGLPVYRLCRHYLEANYPLISRLVTRLYKKRFAQIERKYFSGERNADAFARTKSYRLLLYRKK